MAFFETELQKMFGAGSPVRDARFAGRACMGRLGETTSVKLEFVIQNTVEHYGGIRASVFNCNEGKIDSNVFLFEDILGKKPGRSAKQADISPHVWGYDGKHEWYGYKPNTEDYAAVAAAVNSYLEVFMPSQGIETPMEKPSVLAMIAADREKPRRTKTSAKPGKSRGGAEL